MAKRLELTWIGKENRPRLEPRILLVDPSLSYHAPERVTDDDSFDNRLIFGDNLLALKALEQEYTGKVKCIFIDPPYNTGSAFQHYDDGLEHSIWLGMMRDRLEALWRLLSSDGSLWVVIDDHEFHYLKILMDEVMGRANFVTSIVWQKIYTVKNSARQFSSMHDYLLVYAKNGANWAPNGLPRGDKQDQAYKNPDNDPRGPWKSTPLHARNYYGAGRYEIVSASGRTIMPPSGTYWRISEASYKEMLADDRIWWGQDGGSIPSQKRFLSEVKAGVTPSTLWLHSEAGHNGEAKNELRTLLPDYDDMFLTPKPERLIRQVLQSATSENDLVLDSFAGSGTTGAVAQKMGRRWIMVELGEHCHTHIIPRLKKVIDGTDQGGISQTVGWKGGGGFRYYKLAPSLLKRDKYGQWVINEAYNPEMLSEAMCKHMGFAYQPSEDTYWIHGRSTETDFIYVTTQTLSHEALAHLSEEVGDNRTLLICCSAWTGNAASFRNLTLQKIPNAILHKCEFGHDDYSLTVQNLPMRAEVPPEAILPKKPQPSASGSLFDDPGVEVQA